MILVCPECSTQYEIPSLLPDEGAKVRCTSCSHVWMATNDDVFEPSELLAKEAAEEINDEVSAGEISDDEDSEIEAVSPIEDDSVDEIDFMEVEAPLEGEELADEELVAEEPVVDEDNSQDDIDSLFDEAVKDEPEEDQSQEDLSQDDLDSLFDEVPSDSSDVDDDIVEEMEGEENSQDDIDGLFDEVAGEMADDDENSQNDIDGLFDEDPAEASSNATVDKNQDYSDPFDNPLAARAAKDNENSGAKSGVLAKVPFYQRLTRQDMIGWGCYGLGIVVVACFMIYARVGVVKMIPAMNSVYTMVGWPVNVRGLMFSNIQQNWEIENNQLHLKIEGEITNLTNKYKPLPPLVFGALSEDHREVFRWVMKVRKKPLLPGEKALFKAMVPVPPEHAKQLLISFQ